MDGDLLGDDRSRIGTFEIALVEQAIERLAKKK